MQEERDEMSRKRNQNLKIWEILNLSILQKHETARLEKNMKGVAELSLDEEVIHVTYELNKPSHQKPGTEIGLYQQKHCQLGLKETVSHGWNPGREP